VSGPDERYADDSGVSIGPAVKDLVVVDEDRPGPLVAAGYDTDVRSSSD
jgi:hypothetical protein